MSVQTLYTAATGMGAMETKLDVIANNLANVNTTAFKADRANFEDLFYRHEPFPGNVDQQQNYAPVGTQIGLGSRVQSTQSNFQQGAFESTEEPLDVAIEGQGFFQVQDASTGQILYTRSGNFSLNSNYQLVIGSAQTGRLIDPPITFPPDTTGISITADGQFLALTPQSPQMQQVGQMQLAIFPNAEGLLKLGENLYAQTDASGPPTQANPGQQGTGYVRQGFLEASNVEPVRELIDLITTQRSFELNSQVIQAGDQILQEITNLARNS